MIRLLPSYVILGTVSGIIGYLIIPMVGQSVPELLMIGPFLGIIMWFLYEVLPE